MGILLILAAIFAMIFQNGFFERILQLFFTHKYGRGFRRIRPAKAAYFMGERRAHSGFFFLLGLELKREIAGGARCEIPLGSCCLSWVRPAVSLCPRSFFYAFNHADAFALKGWAIPTATDTAFALGLL